MYSHKLHNDACLEARDLINGWMSEKFCTELQGDDEPSNDLYRDPDAFIKRLIEKDNHSQLQPEIELKPNPYHVDESKSVNQWLSAVQNKLSSFTLSEYEAAEKEKKNVAVKDPRLAMEARQQKVRDARARREEKMKLKLKKNIEKKQTDAIAREIIRQETLEKAHRKKIEEEAIQREMIKIRKQMQDLKKKHEKEIAFETEQTQICETNAEPSTSTKTNQNAKHHISYKLDQKNNKLGPHDKETEIAKKKPLSFTSNREDNYEQVQLLANIQRFETFQKQKLMRKSLHHWIKIVLSKRAAMGKAKAIAEWRLQLKTWSAWRKYFFEQASLREAEIHAEHLKRMSIHDRVASATHQKRLLKKCFSGWKNFVKMEQYTKELVRDQEETKRKMDALIGAVTSKQVSVNRDLLLQEIEDEDSFVESPQSARCKTPRVASRSSRPGAELQHNAPKQAWQVRRRDVHKLTLKQIENIGADHVPPREVTRVKRFERDSARGAYRSRVEASKEVISQQRQMISQQKLIIEEQRRLLAEKTASDEDESCVEAVAPSPQSETKKNKTFQPPKRPKSLLAMEKRAEERMRKREELLERKKQAEEERLERLRLEDEEQKRLEEEEKRKKREERKRIKLLEIEKENERKAFIAKMQQLRKKAEAHYRKTLLSNFGLKPWLKYKQYREEQMKIARCHDETTLCRNVITSWFQFVRSDRIEKEKLSLTFYSALLRRRCFQNWLRYGEAMSILEKKADIYHTSVLKGLYLRKWERFVTNERLAYFEREEIALHHNEKRLLRRGLNIIFMHKQNAKREEERHQRIANMRRKVAELLPDFDPSVSFNDGTS